MQEFFEECPSPCNATTQALVLSRLAYRPFVIDGLGEGWSLQEGGRSIDSVLTEAAGVVTPSEKYNVNAVSVVLALQQHVRL